MTRATIERVAAWFLRILPRDLRDEYGADMIATISRRADDARPRGRLAMLFVLTRELLGLVWTGLSARVPMRRRGSHSIGPGEHMRRELQHALRRLGRAPAFAAVAILTIGLATGATTAVFTLLRRVVIAPLPYPAADRLVALDHTAPGVGLQSNIGMSISAYREYAKLPSVEAIAIYDVGEATLAGDEGAERVPYLFSTPSLGGLLGVRPTLGRWFTAGDGVAGAPSVVVLSDGLWRRRFGASPNVIGSALRIDGSAAEIVGVLPPSFAFPDPTPQFVVPLPLPATWTRAAGFNYQGIARLKPGVDVERARRDQNVVLADLPARYPADPEATSGLLGPGQLASRAEWLKRSMIGTAGTTLWVLFGAASLVLFIACANLANLFLVRSETRHKEIALRRAVGANTASIAAYFVAEPLIVSAIGATVGTLLAHLAVSALVARAPVAIPRVQEIRVDATVIAFAFASALGAGLGIGLLSFARHLGSASSALNDAGRANTASGRRIRTRHVLMGAQVALGVVLFAGTGLMVRSFAHMLRVETGFRDESRLVFRVGLPRGRYRGGHAAIDFQSRALSALRALPGVRSAALTSTLPLEGQGMGNPLEVRGRASGSADATPVARFRRVSDDYFATMGIRRIAGARADVANHSVVVNEALARLYFGDANPIGQQVRALADSGGDWLTIGGVVANTVTYTLRETTPTPQLFIALSDSARGNLPAPHDVSFVVQVDGEPVRFVSAARQTLATLDPSVAISRPERLADLTARSRASLAFAMVLLVFASIIAIVLAVVGVYAVVAYGVVQRSAEIGVRLALGATPHEVTAMLVRQGSRVVAIGIVVGVVTGLASARLLGTLLFGVSATDGATYTFAALGLFAAAMLACWIPARRAARLDPISVLRRAQ